MGHSEDDTASLGIRLILGVIDKFSLNKIVSREQVLGAIRILTSFYAFLPEDLKKQVRRVFLKLWEKRSIFFTTKPSTQEYVNLSVPENIRRLLDLLDIETRTIVIEALQVKRLNERGLNIDAAKLQESMVKRGGVVTGITYMVTTGDIDIFLDEAATLQKTEKAQLREFFRWWAQNYFKIAILISPEELKEEDKLKHKIRNFAKEPVRDYLVIHMLANQDDCDNLESLLNNLKKDGILAYEHIECSTVEYGFLLQLNVKIFFQNSQIYMRVR